MKFIHTSDLHFGGTKFLPNYLDRQEEMLDSIFDVAYDRGIDVVVISGDIFDDSDPTTEERDLVERKFLQYDSAGFHILVIPGNHDLVNMTGYTAIHYLSMLSDHNRFKNSVVTETTRFVRIRDSVFCLLCHRKGKFTKDAKRAVKEFWDSSLDVSTDNFIMVAHETIHNSKSDVLLSGGDYRRLEGQRLPGSRLPVTYWALGDIHKHQRVGKRAFYCGAPVQMKFGDGWPRGVLVVDTAAPDDPEFVPIPSNQLVKARKGDDIPPGAYVKLVGKRDDLVDSDRESNVVKVAFDTPETSLSLEFDNSLEEKILEGVKQQCDDPEVLAVAEREVSSLALASGVDNV